MLRSSIAAVSLLALLAVAPRAGARPAAPPISGIATSDFGGGCGLGGALFLVLGWDAPNSALKLSLVSPTGSVPAPVSQHFLLYGSSLLSTPFQLPAPNWQNGCLLLVLPDGAAGPYPGDTSLIPIPQNPLLVGATFYLQAIPEYAVAAPFAVYGITQGVKLTFL